jgi:hypothetical protein
VLVARLQGLSVALIGLGQLATINARSSGSTPFRPSAKLQLRDTKEQKDPIYLAQLVASRPS